MRLKLVSPEDTLIGHIGVPDEWGAYFERSGTARAAIPSKFRGPYQGLAVAFVPVADIHTVTLALAGWSQYQDAVYLVEGTVEELEALPDCAFAPSRAYLRSQINAIG